jgi:hypothetical protein
MCPRKKSRFACIRATASAISGVGGPTGDQQQYRPGTANLAVQRGSGNLQRVDAGPVYDDLQPRRFVYGVHKHEGRIRRVYGVHNEKFGAAPAVCVVYGEVR